MNEEKLIEVAEKVGLNPEMLKIIILNETHPKFRDKLFSNQNNEDEIIEQDNQSITIKQE